MIGDSTAVTNVSVMPPLVGLLCHACAWITLLRSIASSHSASRRVDDVRVLLRDVPRSRLASDEGPARVALRYGRIERTPRLPVSDVCYSFVPVRSTHLPPPAAKPVVL